LIQRASPLARASAAARGSLERHSNRAAPLNILPDRLPDERPSPPASGRARRAAA